MLPQGAPPSCGWWTSMHPGSSTSCAVFGYLTKPFWEGLRIPARANRRASAFLWWWTCPSPDVSSFGVYTVNIFFIPMRNLEGLQTLKDRVRVRLYTGCFSCPRDFNTMMPHRCSHSMAPYCVGARSLSAYRCHFFGAWQLAFCIYSLFVGRKGCSQDKLSTAVNNRDVFISK